MIIQSEDRMRTLQRHDYNITPQNPIHIIDNMVQIGTSLHQHDFSEIALVTSGRGLHVTGREKWRITRGDAFLIDGNRSHSLSDVHDLEMMLILFDPSLLLQTPLSLKSLPGFVRFFGPHPAKNAQTPFTSRTRLQECDLEDVKKWGHQLRDEIERPGPDRRLRVLTCFFRIAEFLSLGSGHAHSMGLSPRDSIEKVRTYINLYYREKISLTLLSELAGMSPRNLSRLFKKKRGASPIDYLLHRRLTQAATLLRQEGVSVSEAAYRVGFQDSNYFSRQFRAFHHISPRAYRQKHSS